MRSITDVSTPAAAAITTAIPPSTVRTNGGVMRFTKKKTPRL
jgi:hypothetical protein